MRRFRTALVGLGRIGATYADDPLTRRHYRYASHAQVLAEHPSFALEAAVDPDPAAVAQAQARWGIAHAVSSLPELVARYDPEVLVLATPPSARIGAIEACPGVKAVLCEKPLGGTLEEARAFLDLCEARGTLVQVNLWRRCDVLSRKLAAGELDAMIGRPQAVRGLYGNGLLNNGTHLIDFCRMLFGDVASVSAHGPMTVPSNVALAGDVDVACTLSFASGVSGVLQPLDFGRYREIELDVWGESGRLEIANEGLSVRFSPRRAHRALGGADEIAVDAPESLASTVGDALLRVYDNLAAALRGDEGLLSSGASAWQSAVVVEAIRRSAISGDGGFRAVGDRRKTS